ncbi:glycine--tRNA ligase [Stratiformator vulcanicus]|uniref:Glycine--tRNA ligase n=1 Tax=Stratiformator vulcanicus TaxID=2527980 RepID=A0A517R2A8_9PLAN|nr:glycine--tRNA ligase [Stratiformator vulcanicus]QDT37994.1 Glycine--tRNA ligase [Stratiformator vulcanicus]
MSKPSMEKIVALCKRRGLIFQDSEIYGGQNGFWDYGPLGVLLKRNVREAWWHDMVGSHDELEAPAGAPSPFDMVGVETSIIMHPQVWKCSGHYDLFHDFMVDCRETKSRYRFDHVVGQFATAKHAKEDDAEPVTLFITVAGDSDDTGDALITRACEVFGLKKKKADRIEWSGSITPLSNAVELPEFSWDTTVGPEASKPGTLTEPREFNLMFKTTLGALGGDADAAFLRPETAQGIFVNFKNVLDSSRVKIPFGVAQVGKSFRNEITPRNFTFRSREFEQMEIEFFCHPNQSSDWYQYWRERRFAWYKGLGISEENLILREHHKEELAHYSVGTADIEYAFPFLDDGEYGELEGVAHRGDFDLRSHTEGKLVNKGGELVVEEGEDGKPKYRGSGKDLSYFDDQSRERFIPHVIEPSAGADRATLAFICEAYYEDEQPDDKGNMQSRTVMRFHPRIAPIKVAVLPLIKKEGMPEKAAEIYRGFKKAGIEAFYDQQGAIGRRYRRQDEAGTPFCVTIDGETASDGKVTLRDRDSLEQSRIAVDEIVAAISEKVRG